MNWLNENKIDYMNWPPRSLDLNSMENFWGIIARRVNANSKQYDYLKELKQAILIEYSKVSETDLFRLCSSMSDRIFSVAEKHDAITKD